MSLKNVKPFEIWFKMLRKENVWLNLSMSIKNKRWLADVCYFLLLFCCCCGGSCVRVFCVATRGVYCIVVVVVVAV